MNKYTFFYKSKLSQWHMVDFVVSGVKYCCCEQYMMARKAHLFGDFDTEKLIMDTNIPRDHQRLGREVKNFVQSTWDTYKYGIVYEGNYNRFKQNEEDWKLLEATGDTLLVEASPIDRVYGIGLSMNDPKIHDAKNWQGENLLGRILTQVRNDIRSSKFNNSQI